MWIVRAEQDCPSFTCYYVPNTDQVRSALVCTDRWKIRVVEGVISDETFNAALQKMNWDMDFPFPNYAHAFADWDQSVEDNLKHPHRKIVDEAMDLVYFRDDGSWIEVD